MNKIWKPANVYKTAKLGNGVSVGRYAEVGNFCVVGDGTRIGKGAFICEGVTIGKNCFIGPHCCFSNDKFPPSDKSKWRNTLVKDGASLGAGVMVLPGVVIGKNALVGMGSVVTKNIPDGETWCGNPARRLRLTMKTRCLFIFRPICWLAGHDEKDAMAVIGDKRTCEWRKCHRCGKVLWQQPYLPPDYLYLGFRPTGTPPPS